MSIPCVSAIICTCNRDDSIREAITSVLSQDYRGKLELIVVDQSRNHSPEVAAFLRAQGDRLRLIQQAEPNLPKARNAGIAVAGGEVLLFMDDDVILPSRALGRLTEHLGSPGPKGVAGLVVSQSDPQESLRAYARQLRVASVDTARGLHRVDSFIGALMMVSTQAVISVGGFDARLGRLTPTAYGEDDDFCYRLRQAGVPLWIDPFVRVLHRDYLPGGCGSRGLNPVRARKYHIKSMVYIRIKHHRRLGVRGWLQVARAHIVNRKTLCSGPRRALQNFAAARTAIREVRSFLAGPDFCPAANGAFPAINQEAMRCEPMNGREALQPSTQEF